MLPSIFLGSAYIYGGWAGLGLAPPPPGFVWVRYGPDMVLVNQMTGEIADVAYGVFL
jgi:Ni/Co efflux regulator RcnB